MPWYPAAELSREGCNTSSQRTASLQRSPMSHRVHTIAPPNQEVAMPDNEVTDVRSMRMKNMGVDVREAS